MVFLLLFLLSLAASQGQRSIVVGQTRGNKVHSFSVCGINAVGRRSTRRGLRSSDLADRPTDIRVHRTTLRKVDCSVRPGPHPAQLQLQLLQRGGEVQIAPERTIR